MFCSECGARVEDGARFCPQCGSPIEEEPPFAGEAAAWAGAPQQPMGQPAQMPVQAPQQPAAQPMAQPYGRAEGFLQAQGMTPQRNRGSNIVAIVAAIVSIAAIAVVVMVLSRRFGSAANPFGGMGDIEAFDQNQDDPGTVVVTPEDTGPVIVSLEGQDAPKEDGDSYTYGASAPAGNLINGGYVAGADDWVYYAIPEAGGNWHTNAIGRMHEDGSEKSTIYRSPSKNVFIWHIVVEGGRLYFVEEGETGSGAEVVTIECNGSGRKVLSTCLAESSFMLNDGVIYAQVKGGLYAYEPKTGKSRTITGGPGSSDLWRIWGEGDNARVYYFEKGSSKLYAASLSSDKLSGNAIVDLGGGNGKPKGIVNAVPSADGLWLLVDTSGDGKGDEIWKAALGGTGLERYAKTSGPATRINANDEGVFVVVSDSASTRIERVGVNGTDAVFFSASPDADVRLPVVVGSYLYFGNYDTQHIMRLPLSSPGGKAEQVS